MVNEPQKEVQNERLQKALLRKGVLRDVLHARAASQPNPEAQAGAGHRSEHGMDSGLDLLREGMRRGDAARLREDVLPEVQTPLHVEMGFCSTKMSHYIDHDRVKNIQYCVRVATCIPILIVELFPNVHKMSDEEADQALYSVQDTIEEAITIEGGEWYLQNKDCAGLTVFLARLPQLHRANLETLSQLSSRIIELYNAPRHHIIGKSGKKFYFLTIAL